MRAQDNKELSDSERSQLRGAISAFMSEHPARAPFDMRALDWAERSLAHVSRFFTAGRSRFALSAALVLLVGSGTSYAAEAALPGQALYAVKIGINERISAVFAMSPASSARFEAQLVERRLEEAESLAALGKLTLQGREQIELNLSVATANFAAQIAKLATSSESDIATAANVQSDLEATLVAHAQVLAAIGSAVPEASSVVVSLEASVHGHMKTVRDARVKLDDQLAASSSAPLAAAAKASGESAAEAALYVQALVPQAAANLGASTSAAVARSASSVEREVAAGEEHMKRGSYGKAFDAFQVAIREAQQTRAAVNATEQLKKVIPSLPSPSNGVTIKTESEMPPISTTAATGTAAGTNTPDGLE